MYLGINFSLIHIGSNTTAINILALFSFYIALDYILVQISSKFEKFKEVNKVIIF